MSALCGPTQGLVRCIDGARDRHVEGADKMFGMTDDEWWDPDDEMGIWEHQGRAFTVEVLRRALADLDPDTVVTIEHYDGAGGVRALRPMPIDLRIRPQPAALVITVV